MKKSSIVALIIVLVILIGGGIFALTRNSKPAASTTSTSTDSSNTDTTSTPAADTDTTATDTTTPAATTTISYNGSSFSPASVTVKAGDSIMVSNTSSKEVEFNSDPHPSHTDNPELNIGSIAAGKSVTITIKKVGSWGYHNHLNPSQTGTVVIQ